MAAASGNLHNSFVDPNELWGVESDDPDLPGPANISFRFSPTGDRAKGTGKRGCWLPAADDTESTPSPSAPGQSPPAGKPSTVDGYEFVSSPPGSGQSPTANVAPTAPMYMYTPTDPMYMYAPTAPIYIPSSDPSLGGNLASAKKSQACADSSSDGSAEQNHQRQSRRARKRRRKS
ncbi:hypothetical protein B0T26DRAFT_752754 [Lasiosphaeria miniovina]|uniref:Uncharacterized protein n=1 Tax=Lasiosphaeria miniovina TaxID=1954250 RepID=A0AA40AAY0_9PEZI|nr:uncharacterized protein B0T26DRAFT_752754 [Lasiosphaeria miniovina]KAK0712527.1 hypothetical protein B0T26DRAFT_752754 [Lasiosphaeria miniovina]